MPRPRPNPWRTTGSRRVYANPWFRVREDEVVRPDGSAGRYGVVEFVNVAVGVVPVFGNGDTVLVGQHRYTLDAWSWEIAEGGADPARDPRAEAARELREETGLRAARWTPLGKIHTSNSVTDERGLLWLAEDLTEHAPEPDATEVLRQWRLPLDQAVAMALDGDITDALSVAGLCRAHSHLHRRSAG